MVEVPEYKLRETFLSADLDSRLSVKGGLMNDSLCLDLVNPLDLDVSWFLYEGDQLLTKGAGKAFRYEKDFIDESLTYYLEIFFVMGGEEQVLRKMYVPKKDYLQVDVDLPGRIYPGQKLDARIKVSDSKGRGVKGVDLTAFAYNSQLNYQVPDLPYYGRMPKGRQQKKSYSINERSVHYTSPLNRKNYDFWNRLAGLDKLPYYRFTYPDPRLHLVPQYSLISVKQQDEVPFHDIFCYTMPTPDGTTEFAPYVMKGGEKQHVYAIELDDKPVYLSWTEQPQRYSFLTESNRYHRIMIRLYDRAVFIDQFCFSEGQKTILSLDLDRMPKSRFVRSVMLNARDQYGRYLLSAEEKKTYNRYVAQLPVPSNRYTYMQTGDTIMPITH